MGGMATKSKVPLLEFFRQHSEVFLPLGKGLLESEAYKTLKPIQIAIFVDWLRLYYELSQSDTKRLPDGFPYTWTVCRVQCSENTFNRARHAIADRGFFVAPARIQSPKPGAPTMWCPSTEWRRWKPGREGKTKAQAAEASKKRRVAQKRRRRTDYLASARKSEMGKKEPPRNAPITPSRIAPIRDAEDEDPPHEMRRYLPDLASLPPSRNAPISRIYHTTVTNREPGAITPALGAPERWLS